MKRSGFSEEQIITTLKGQKGMADGPNGERERQFRAMYRSPQPVLMPARQQTLDLSLIDESNSPEVGPIARTHSAQNSQRSRQPPAK